MLNSLILYINSHIFLIRWVTGVTLGVKKKSSANIDLSAQLARLECEEENRYGILR